MLYVHLTHFVSDRLKVRSKASKLPVSFLIIFQLGALQIQRQFLLRNCSPPAGPAMLSQPHKERMEAHVDCWETVHFLTILSL